MNAFLLALTMLLQFNLQFPPARPIPCRSDTLTVTVIGDVMMHSRQLEHDHRTFLKEIAPVLEKADIAVGNMEFPLAGAPYSGYPAFSTPDWYADYLENCGIDVFLLANNHVLDKCDAGLRRTLDIYSTMASEGRISYTGAAAHEAEFERLNPLVVSRKGIRIAFVNFTYGTNIGSAAPYPKVSRMRREEVHAQFERAKADGADFIVALPHWGNEYELNHSKAQEEWARWMVEEGADVIVGAHPHVVQDTTHIEGVPVIYSMGNAVSNMSAENTRLELCVTLRFVRSFPERKKMLEPELRWMWCTLPGMLTDSYATVFVDEWEGRRDEWKTKSDYDNMIRTRERVEEKTGVRNQK